MLHPSSGTLLVVLIHELQNVEEHVDDVKVEDDAGHDVAVFVNLILIVPFETTRNYQLSVVDKVEAEQKYSDGSNEEVQFWTEEDHEERGYSEDKEEVT